jgi:hypothetical protein
VTVTTKKVCFPLHASAEMSSESVTGRQHELIMEEESTQSTNSSTHSHGDQQQQSSRSDGGIIIPESEQGS